MENLKISKTKKVSKGDILLSFGDVASKAFKVEKKVITARLIKCIPNISYENL